MKTAKPTLAAKPQIELSFDADMYKKLFPAEYMRTCLASGVRPDARTPDAARSVQVQTHVVHTAASSSLVKFGQTSVIAAIKLAVGLPAVATPDQGDLAIHVHLTPLCSTRYNVGRPSEEAQRIGSQLTDIVVGSRVVEMADLSIEASKSAWKLWIDVLCLEDDGNVLDASLVAVIAALQTLELPAVSINDVDHVVTIQPDQPAIALPLQHSAFATSFAIVDDVVVIDPTANEEVLAAATVSVTYSTRGQLCSVHKPGGAVVSPQVLLQCMKTAKARMQMLAAQVERGTTAHKQTQERAKANDAL